MKTVVKVRTRSGPYRDLQHRWDNRIRSDREVCGAIELAYRRGYQAGLEDAIKPKRRKERRE